MQTESVSPAGGSKKKLEYRCFSCGDHENRVDFWSGSGLKAPVFLVIF
jgi:hypothetical protein